MPFISYLAILTISFFFNIVPRKISLLAGRIFGASIYYLFPIRKKVALKNIGSLDILKEYWDTESETFTRDQKVVELFKAKKSELKMKK